MVGYLFTEGASNKEHELVQCAIDTKGLDRGTLRTNRSVYNG
jgi:hypothetical protein